VSAPNRPTVRVAVTGLGVITALGSHVSEFWDNLLAGRSGIRRVTQFDPAELPCQIAGEIPDQRWISDTRRRFPEWWSRRVLHDRPDVADRLFRAGRVCTEAQAAAGIRGNIVGA
jgi:3-oxoacyl-(acyl-carrier-protein) synthase